MHISVADHIRSVVQIEYISLINLPGRLKYRFLSLARVVAKNFHTARYLVARSLNASLARPVNIFTPIDPFPPDPMRFAADLLSFSALNVLPLHRPDPVHRRWPPQFCTVDPISKRSPLPSPPTVLCSRRLQAQANPRSRSPTKYSSHERLVSSANFLDL